MSNNKSRKRNFRESNEFMPLSKGKLFESDDESNNCEYDWGFRKSDRTLQQDPENNNNSKRAKKTEDIEIINKKMIYHKSLKPYEIKKEEEKEMYMENLSKVYERSYAYIPTFYDVDEIDFTNIDGILDKSIADVFTSEIESISQLIDNFWLPLKESYITTQRLSKSCVAYEMITISLAKYTKMKQLYEKAMKTGDIEYKSELNTWINMDVDSVTKVFRDSAGNILLKYKDSPEVTFDEMAKESNIDMFSSLVKEDLAVVQKQVRKNVAARKEKMQEEKSDESEGEQEPGEHIDNRPASKALLDNKGIVPKRKRADANPRVKHRMKFKKALVRYHSQVPRKRDDAGNYQGEQSGIRVAVIKSQKFK